MKLTSAESAAPFASAPQPWGKRGILILVLALLLGGALRIYDLGGPSFSDDEVYKLNAVKSYREGRWAVTGDDEHPLALKLLIYATFAVRDVWNGYVAKDSTTIDLGLESATRGPNALFGTLTALLLAFLGRELFSRRVGLIAALLWSVDIIAIGYNRIAKEDTLLAFFLIWSFYFVIRAKRMAEIGEPVKSRRYEIFAAMMIGALCASKYFFHMTVPIVLFYLWSRYGGRTSWRVSPKRWLQLVGVAFATFLVINPTCLHPGNLRYIADYMREHTVLTHGYLFLDKLYYNNAFEALSGGHGTPWYYYLLYVSVKAAPPVLVAILIGFGHSLVKRNEDGPRVIFSWLFIWFLVHGLLSGAKWGRFTAHLMPPLLLLAAVGIDATARFLARALQEVAGWRVHAGATVAGLAALAMLPELKALREAAPHYRMYLNVFGGSPERLRHYFPHCDLYDVGVREAMFYICARAEFGAQVRSDAPVVTSHYAQICGRQDLKVTMLSQPSGECEAGRSCYQVLQIGRTFFENRPIVERLHAERAPDAIVRARGLNVAEIYGPDNLGGREISIHNSVDAELAGVSARTSSRPSEVSALAFDGPRGRRTYRLAPARLGLTTDRHSIVEEIATDSKTP